MSRKVAGFALEKRVEAHGRVRLALVDDAGGARVDSCVLTIDPLELHDGAGGVVRVNGIGNVATLEAYRRRGLASELMAVAIEHMRAGDADGSLLYGIDGFYEPFGWRTCGDERWVVFEASRGRAERVASPEGSRAHARGMREDDRAPMRELYERIAASVRGAVVRDAGGATWSRLEPNDVVVVERHGELVGWAWRGIGHGARGIVQEGVPGAAAFLELQAVDIDAAWHVVQAAREVVATSDDAELRRLATGAPDGHPLRELVRSSSLDVQLVDVVRPHGGAMLLPFTDAAQRVAHDTYQFIPDRF